MIKNYFLTKKSNNLKRDNTIISLLFLFIFLVISINIQAQSNGQPSIGTPIINPSVCGDSSVDVIFTVRNGNDNGNDKKRFTASTIYRVYITPVITSGEDEITVLSTKTLANYGNDTEEVTLTVEISNTYATADYQIRVVSSRPDADSGLSDQFEIKARPAKPITTGGLICIGSTANLSASGAVAGESYKWYNVATGGTLLKTSTNNSDNTYVTPVISATTNYWVSILNSNGCESTRTIVTATFPVNSTDLQTTTGTNTWIGHVYDGTNIGMAFNGNFTNYFGTYSEAETFDQNFGGDNICFPVSSSLGSRSIYTETFSVRYRMNSTKKGLYVVDLGSGDGSRLTVDGTLLYNNWTDQAWSLRPRVLMNLTGNSQLVYDFYENRDGNRVNFNNLTQILENKLTENTNQTICSSTTAAAISGDTFGTLPAGLSAAGYQWTYSTNLEEPRINIAGATSASFTPNINAAPFNNPGTYYIFRNASLSSSNNIDPNTQTSESNFVIVNVNGQPEGMLKGVNLGTAGNFTILTKSGITNVPTSSVKGDVGASPISGTAILLTCSEVTGTIYSVDPAGPEPCTVTDASKLTVAVLDMETAYTDAAGRANPDFVDLGSGNLGGKTLTPGLYKFNSVVTIPTDITISGGSNDIWIFQISGTFNLSSATKIILAGGAQAKNIFWQISGAVTLGTYSHFEGNIIGKTNIAMQTEASINGRMLAQTAVTLQMNDVNGLVPPGTVFPDIQNNIIGEDQTVCEGFNPKTLTGTNVTGGNGTYTYLWESSTTNSSSGFAPAKGQNDLADYDPEKLRITTWFRRTVTSGSCTWDTSSPVKISINSSITNNQLSFTNGISGTLCGTANKNGVVNLSAPAETVFNYVNFASYGTPGGTCGNFTVNLTCHSQTSQAVSETYLLGNNTSNIPATNAVFGDPCSGTGKRLYVEASYSQPICNGTDPGAISGTMPSGGDGNYTYLWESSSSGPSSGFVPATGSNTFQNYSPGILTQTIWLKRTVTSSNCSNESPVLLIQVKQDNIWTGATDTDWNNTANWSCNSLPTLETDVLIPENLTSNNFPVINAGTNALSKNLSIENGASVIVNENWLRIAGDLTNSGVLTTENGSVSFEGASAQSIPNAAFANNRIQNLRINNTLGVISEAIIEVTGTLNVAEGNFDTGNELTLISNQIQTALIDGSGNGEVLGLVSMQRYLDKAFGYKYFSAPFQNSVVGDFAPYMDFQDPISEFPNFYRYEENRNVNINDTIQDATGWEVYTNTASNLNIAEGYALNFGTSNAAQTIELIGEVNNGPVPTRQLSNNHHEYTRGFHLVGNPYPSPIDWDATQGWTKNNIDDGIYFFTASDTSQYTGTYTAYVNNISTGDPLVDGRSSNIIPSMQGFFVKVSDSDTQDLVTGSFGMDNDVRVTNFDQQFLRSQVADLKSLIRLEAGFIAANHKDPMVIYFSSYATQNFEKEMDAHKLMNTNPAVPSFYNITQNKKELAINAIPFPETKSYKKIPLGIKANQSGKMTINLASVENLSSNFNIYLIDHEKSKGQNLRNDPEYTFNIKAGTHNSRFELMFSEEKITSPAIAFNEPFDVKVEDGNVVVSLNLEENQQGILRASTITGQILQIKEAGGKDRVVFKGITSDGVYIINLQLGKTMLAKKVLFKK